MTEKRLKEEVLNDGWLRREIEEAERCMAIWYEIINHGTADVLRRLDRQEDT